MQHNRSQESTGCMQVVSNLVDMTSLRAQHVGAEVTQKLQQACDNVAVQTEVSQGAFQVSALQFFVLTGPQTDIRIRTSSYNKIRSLFWDKIDCWHSSLSVICVSLLIDLQEWKGLMTGILSKEASKIQAELDHASRTVSSWPRQQPAGADTLQASSCLCLHKAAANHILSLQALQRLMLSLRAKVTSILTSKPTC